MYSFLSCFKNPTTGIDQSITQTSAAVVSRNRQYIASILCAIEYCGRQGIALRGHRDDGPLFHKASSNRGNFKELIMLMSEFDKTLKYRIESCARNATYLSKTIQNDLLSCIKDFIRSEIVNDIQNQTEEPFFGISADEVTDVSNWEQLEIVVRCVRSCRAIEKLLEFVQCDDIKGASMEKFIINTLDNAGLYPGMCRAQTYDGAGNMAGKEKGAAAKFCFETGNEKAVYFHCTSHELNLSLSKSYKILQIMKMVRRCKCWVYFLNTHQNVNENWNSLLQKLLLNHLKRTANHCVKHVGWKGTQHLQI